MSGSRAFSDHVPRPREGPCSAPVCARGTAVPSDDHDEGDQSDKCTQTPHEFLLRRGILSRLTFDAPGSKTAYSMNRRTPIYLATLEKGTPMKPRMVILAVLAILAGLCVDAFAQSPAVRATPNSKIPTVSLTNVARQGFYYAGGKYVGELGDDKESTMGGAMYVEVMVPEQIRSPYPIVFLHGAGQTGVDWLITPDGRPGWAYNFLDMGYVVYLQDFPTRGRSQYVPGVDGTPGNQPEHPHREQPRRDLYGGGGARRHPAGEEAHAVARHRPHRRQDLRRFQQDAGAVPRRATARKC